MDSVYIILVNFNNCKYTTACIESIKKSTYENYRIVVVDNASVDDSFDVLTSAYKNDEDVFILKSDANNGFSAGNNIGIRFALNNKASYIMLLNNDTEIDPKMVEVLHSKANENTVTTSKMYYHSKPDTLWYAGGEVAYKTGKIKHYGLNEEDTGRYSNERFCSFVTGCCVMIHKNIIQRVGLLDESYFMYGEDVDYSIRLSKAGVRILYLPDAKLWHKVGGSSTSNKFNIYYDTRNRLFLMDKFDFPKSSKIRFRFRILLLYIRGLLKRSNDRYFKKAYIDYKNGVIGKIVL